MLYTKYQGSSGFPYIRRPMWNMWPPMAGPFCPQGGGGTSWTHLVEVHYVILHTKYRGSRPCCCRTRFSLYKPMLCLFLTSHQQLRSYRDWVRLKSRPTDWWTGDRSCDPWFTRQVVYPLHHSDSLYKPIQNMWTRSGALFGHNLNKLGRGLLGDATYHISML